MKKNSQKKAMLKPEVGDYYEVCGNVIEILRVEGYKAFYKMDHNEGEVKFPWDFVKYPHGVDRKLTSLEVELL